jgi:hypothetical protein
MRTDAETSTARSGRTPLDVMGAILASGRGRG